MTRKSTPLYNTMEIARYARLLESQKIAQLKREIKRDRRINKPLNLWG